MSDDTPKTDHERDPYRAPHVLAGYQASDEPPLVADPAEPPLAETPTGADNRGRPAGITAAGEVVGSGAGAGGKGGPEDFDSDPQAADGTFMVGHPDKPNRGGDGSKHNST